MPKVKEKSLHAALWRFTYKKDLPGNLCPYFWKLVWGFIAFIPNFIVQLPYLVYELFGGTKDNCSERRGIGFAIWCLVGIIWLYIVLTWNWGCAMFGYNYDQAYANIGWVLHLIVAIIAIYLLYKNYRKNKTIIEKTPGLIKEFVKAKYHRYCPKLEWVKADGTIRTKE
jgi:hypothetical protein